MHQSQLAVASAADSFLAHVVVAHAVAEASSLFDMEVLDALLDRLLFECFNR